MRKNDGDHVRIFNGRDGEFIGEIRKTGKKTADLHIIQQTRRQTSPARQIHLYFAPIKKDRLGFLVEKSVELGVTDLHPVITAHTENRKPAAEKIRKQIIEAAEQCERMDLPSLHPVLSSLGDIPFDVMPFYAAIERMDAPLLAPRAEGDIAFLVGPEGGWSVQETDFLCRQSLTPVTLGPSILRAETAVIAMLAKAL